MILGTLKKVLGGLIVAFLLFIIFSSKKLFSFFLLSYKNNLHFLKLLLLLFLQWRYRNMFIQRSSRRWSTAKSFTRKITITRCSMSKGSRDKCMLCKKLFKTKLLKDKPWFNNFFLSILKNRKTIEFVLNYFVSMLAQVIA